MWTLCSMTKTISHERANSFHYTDKYYRIESTHKPRTWTSAARPLELLDYLSFFYFVSDPLSSFKSFEVSFFVPPFSSSLLNNFMSALVNLPLYRSPSVNTTRNVFTLAMARNDVIDILTRENMENPPLRSRMKFLMNFTSGVFKSKTLASI